MIYTTAALVAKHNVCEGGVERTAAALAREGKTMDTRVTMQHILQSLGLTDALYSFAEVEPESKDEATKVIREYSRRLVGTMGNLILIPAPHLGDAIAGANAVLNKRFDGITRTEVRRRSTVALARIRAGMDKPELRYWLQGYLEFLSPKPDYLAATHATVAFVEGCRAGGIYDAGLEKAREVLSDLLGGEE